MLLVTWVVKKINQDLKYWAWKGGEILGGVIREDLTEKVTFE